MKHLAFFLTTSCVFVSGALFAQDFATGQAARAVIGQKTFTAQDPGASDELIGGVSGLAYANDTLFVADSNRVGSTPQNNRVLVYNNVSGMIPAPTAELFFDRPCPVCLGKASLVLGQPDFSKTDFTLKADGMRLPTAVATDGQRLVVADTDNNRVLIWNTIPTTIGKAADVVVGQSSFTSAAIPSNTAGPNSKSLRGPQGVWIQNGKLFVADTQNHRVLIWNSIPTSNQKEADVVIGQPDFNTFVELDLTKAKVSATSSNLLNPVSVTSDGQRMYVADLGHNRVLIWNSIPTRNQTPADIVIGQTGFSCALPNHTLTECDPAKLGEDYTRNRTLATLDFPRFALSDGQRLFIADGGNDRVLIYNRIPTTSTETADYVIGQLSGGINQASDSTDSMRSPMSLAWDGTNLYVSDSFNRRIMVYSIGKRVVPYSGVRNAASREIFGVGSITFDGEVKKDDTVTIKIGVDLDSDGEEDDGEYRKYEYKIVEDDTFTDVVNQLTEKINTAPDPNLIARTNPTIQGIILRALAPGADGNKVEYSVTTSDAAVILFETSGAQLSGGQDAASIGPGTIVQILGDDLTDYTAGAPTDRDALPDTLEDTQVYFDGIRAPLYYVSPTQINAQIPFEVSDRTSVSAFVRTRRRDGNIEVTTPRAVTIVPQNPGIFAGEGSDPRPAVMLHASPAATGTVSFDGSVTAGETVIVTIEDREYRYRVVEGDTLRSVRDNVVSLINASGDERVEARIAVAFGARLQLVAKVPGPDGLGIKYAGKSLTKDGAAEGAALIVTAFSQELCCANSGLVTPENPAVPGETVIIYASGLGRMEPQYFEETGKKYKGPPTEPIEFVSSLAGNKTANVLGARLKEGEVGIYEVLLELNSDLPTDPFTQLTIAQFTFVSNIVTFPVVNPKPATQ